MGKLLIGVAVSLLLTSSAIRAGEGFTPLFDGRSLDGWEGDQKIFRVQDGAIVGGSLDARVARNEFLCTKSDYGDFELRVQFKLLGTGANAGVQFRSRRIPNHHEVRGYQADLGDGLEEGPLPVGGHGDAGRAEGAGEAEEDLLGRADVLRGVEPVLDDAHHRGSSSRCGALTA